MVIEEDSFPRPTYYVLGGRGGEIVTVVIQEETMLKEDNILAQ